MKLAHHEIPTFVKNIFFPDQLIADDDPRINAVSNPAYSYDIREIRLLLLFLSFYLYPPEKLTLAYVTPSTVADRIYLFSDECPIEIVMQALRHTLRQRLSKQRHATPSIRLSIAAEARDEESKIMEDVEWIGEDVKNPITRLTEAFSYFSDKWHNFAVARIDFAHLIRLNNEATHSKLTALCRATRNEKAEAHKTVPYYVLDALENCYIPKGRANFAACHLYAVPNFEQATLENFKKIYSSFTLYVGFATEAGLAFTQHARDIPFLNDYLCARGIESPLDKHAEKTPVNGGLELEVFSDGHRSAPILVPVPYRLQHQAAAQELMPPSTGGAGGPLFTPVSATIRHTSTSLVNKDNAVGEEKKADTDSASTAHIGTIATEETPPVDCCGCFSFSRRRI